jgi:hypothetical protein
MDLATGVNTPELRATFLELPDKWTKLAIELEKPRKPRRRPATESATRSRPPQSVIGRAEITATVLATQAR